MYSEKVMDHFTNPRNVGEMADADGVGTEGNPTCGDVMQIFIKVKDGKIVDAKFKTFGCGAAIAVSSMITELVKGRTLDEALSISKETVANELAHYNSNGTPHQIILISNGEDGPLVRENYLLMRGHYKEGFEPSPNE